MRLPAFVATLAAFSSKSAPKQCQRICALQSHPSDDRDGPPSPAEARSIFTEAYTVKPSRAEASRFLQLFDSSSR